MVDKLRRQSILNMILNPVKKYFSDNTSDNTITEIVNKLADTLVQPPRIAIIGKTGVGKSSTLKALFSPEAEIKIGHVVATTKKPQEITFESGHKKGLVTLVDFPGLGESLNADSRYIPMYKEQLQTCDVILWVLMANVRDLACDQRYINEVILPEYKNRLVIGLNQVDIIKPGKWISEFNVPSEEQSTSITLKVNDIKEKLSEINVNVKRVVEYSAEQGWHLEVLFRVILEACSQEKGAILSKRANIKPFSASGLE